MRLWAQWGLVFLVLAALPLSAQSSGTVQYFYDDVGRLIKVVTPTGNVATYKYDAVGNLLSITRSTLPANNGLAILNFTPQTGPVGQIVTIQGQGFSATPSLDVVQFNGTAATVTAATSSTLTVAVPTGATTGPISVTVNGQSANSGTNFVITAGTLVAINITPAGSTLNQGVQQQFAANGLLSNGTHQDVTSSVTWGSSIPTVASISNAAGSAGVATGVGSGTTSITAISGSIIGSTTLTVRSLVSISVIPSPSSVAVGLTQQFAVTGSYSDGSVQNLTAGATWNSSNTAVATISSSGLATPLAVGNSTICATLPGFESCSYLTVTPALVSISIAPLNETIPKGINQQFSATGTFSDGSKQSITSLVIWKTSSSAVAIINSNSGLATDIGVGTATITATAGSISGSTTLTLTTPVPTSLTVSPATLALQPGGAAQLEAQLLFTDNSTQNATQTATWSSSAASIATVSNAAGSQGMVTGVAAGSATITATSGSVSGSAVAIVSNPNSNLFPRFLYTGNGDGSISTYGITGSTGQLRFNGSSPGVAGVAASVFALDPQQQFLFGAGTAVSVYAVNASNGTLTQVSGSPFALSGVSPTSIVTDPSGKFLYIGYRSSTLVSGFAIDRTTGALTALPGSPYTTTGYTDSLLVHPSGKYLFVTNLAYNVHGSVSVFTIDPTTGALMEIPGSPFGAGVDPVSLAQDPAGKFLLVSNSGQNFGSHLRPIVLPGSSDTIETTRLGPPSPIGSFSAGGRSSRVPADGSHSAPADSNGVLVASLDLTNTFPFAESGVAADVMPSVARKFPLFQSGSHNGPGISVFAVDATSGTLSEVSGSPFTSGHLNNYSGSLAMNPNGQFVYVVSDFGFVGFNLDSNTGALTELADSPYAAPYTYYAAWDPTGQFLYASGQSAQTGVAFIQEFSLNPNTGTLTSVGNSPARSLASALAVSSGGNAISYLPQFAFVASGSAGVNGVASYSIDPSAGALTAVSGSPFVDGLSPVFAASAASGQYLYLVNHCSDPTCFAAAGSVSVYSIDPNAGVPTAIPSSPFLTGGNPVGIAFDPSGQFAYVINAQDGTVSIYSVDPSSGTFTPISGSPFLTSSGAVAAAVAPFESQFLLAAKCPTCTNGSLYVYGLYAPNIGQWAGLNQTLPLGTAPTALAIDPVGNFALVTDALSNSVAVFSGAYTLAQVTGSPFATGQNPVSIALDPLGRFVFIANQASNNVSAFTIDPVLGILTPIAGSPFVTGIGPISVTVDYSGRFLYLVNAGDSTVSAFAINQVSGVLTPVANSPFAAAAAPASVTTTGKIQ